MDYIVTDLGDLHIPFGSEKQCLLYIKQHILRIMENFLPDKEYFNTFTISYKNRPIWSKTISLHHGSI